MLPGDRLVCAFIGPVKPGSTFKLWLLHVTIVPWFRLPDSSAVLADGLKRAFVTIGPFGAVVGQETRFGPKKNRPAHLLDGQGFAELEQRTRRYLRKKRAWLVDETTKRRRQFRPHVTFQGDEHLQEGGELNFDKVYIVEQKGDYKEVVAEINLG